MNVLICPDKFKGSLTAMEVCQAIDFGVKEVLADATCTMLPLADGGEGTLAVLEEILGLETQKTIVNDPLFRPTIATYGLKGEEAYIEMARASGFELLTDDERSATKTSSIGTGELIKDAITKGAKKVHLFVGGSATNDGGIGLASALGFRFLDENSEEISPIGENLSQIESIEGKDISVDIHLVTDVQNPLLGTNGASFQYGPQKGASKEDVSSLEKGMKHLSDLVATQYGTDISNVPGSGAAGGIGLSILGLINGTIHSGINTILSAVKFSEAALEANLVITGEGKIDEQTLQGKVVHGVLQETHKANVPVVVICGDSALSQTKQESLNAEKVLKLKTDELTVDYCLEHAKELIKIRIADFLRNHNFPQ